MSEFNPEINKSNMFSGIVEGMARVVAIEKDQENIHFTLECPFTSELKIDQSVAHNGVCLTVVKIEGNSVLLEFCANEVPQFISTSQMKGLLNDKSTGKQFSTVKITGKVLLNRFSLIKIEV